MLQILAARQSGHWTIENRLNWCLDLTMDEARMRNRLDHAPRSLPTLRNMAVNLVHREISKGSFRKKLGRALSNNSFLVEVLPQL